MLVFVLFILWVIFITIGSIVAQFLPEEILYIYGYIVGIISYTALDKIQYFLKEQNDMKNYKNQLKPCPLCGGEVSVALGGDESEEYFFITRGTGKNPCRCRLFLESDPFSPDNEERFKVKVRNDLIKQWNNRVGG